MTGLGFEWRALAFAAAASLLAAMISIPAIQASGAALPPGLAETSRSVSGERRRLQRCLVVSERAVTVVLLASAGLLLRSYYNLIRVDAGFSTANVVTFSCWCGMGRGSHLHRAAPATDHRGAARLAGVESAGFTSFLPATGATLNVSSHPARRRSDASASHVYSGGTHDHFSLLTSASRSPARW
jgi:hypothetical protein